MRHIAMLYFEADEAEIPVLSSARSSVAIKSYTDGISRRQRHVSMLIKRHLMRAADFGISIIPDDGHRLYLPTNINGGIGQPVP